MSASHLLDVRFLDLYSPSHLFLNEIQNIVGSVMDSNAIRRLERELAAMQVTVHSMQNIWASDVWYIDPLAEARNMFQELTNR